MSRPVNTDPCVECGARMRRRTLKKTPGDPRPQQGSRGMCEPCYRAAVPSLPKTTWWSTEDCLHEVEFFLEWCGMWPEDIPARLGYRRDTFLTVIRRGVAAGDARAQAWSLRAGLGKAA